MEKELKNDFGVASLILGIASILFCAIPLFGFIFGGIGLFCYFKQKKIYENTMNTAGLITTIIGIVLSILLFNLFITLYSLLNHMGLM